MAKILLGISVLLMVGSAVLGFLTKGKVSDLQSEKKSLTESVKTQEKATAKAKDETKLAQEQLTAETAKVTTLESEIQSAKTALDASQSKLAAAQGELDAAKKKYDEFVQTHPQTPGGPVTDPSTLLTQLQSQLAEAQSRLAEAQQVNQTLTAKAESASSRTVELERAEQVRKQGLVRKGLQGKVMAVNQAYNFAVLSLGDRQGVIAGAEMLVMRGPNLIGKVRISSVEPSSSIADIIPTSLAKGAFVQPGDTVVFRGS